MKNLALSLLTTIMFANTVNAQDANSRAFLTSFLNDNGCSRSVVALMGAFNDAKLDGDQALMTAFQLIETGDAVMIFENNHIALQSGEVCSEFEVAVAPLNPKVLDALISAYERNNCVLDLDSRPLRRVGDRYSVDEYGHALMHLLNGGQLRMTGRFGGTSTFIGSDLCTG